MEDVGRCGVVAGKKVVGVPSMSSRIVVLDTTDNSVEYINLTSWPIDDRTYMTSQVASGQVFVFPGVGVTDMMVIDPIDLKKKFLNLTNYLDAAIIGSQGQGAFFRTSAMVENKAVAIPCSMPGGKFLVAEISNTMSSDDVAAYPTPRLDINSDGYGQCAYSASAVLGNQVIGLPNMAPDVLIFDPASGTYDMKQLLAPDLTSDHKDRYLTAAVVGNVVIGLPAHEHRILWVEARENGAFDVQLIDASVYQDSRFTVKYRTSSVVGSKVVGVPFKAGKILVFDVPSQFSAVTAASVKLKDVEPNLPWASSVAIGDKVVAVPDMTWQVTRQKLLVYDTYDNSVTYLDVGAECSSKTVVALGTTLYAMPAYHGQTTQKITIAGIPLPNTTTTATETETATATTTETSTASTTATGTFTATATTTETFTATATTTETMTTTATATETLTATTSTTETLTATATGTETLTVTSTTSKSSTLTSTTTTSTSQTVTSATGTFTTGTFTWTTTSATNTTTITNTTTSTTSSTTTASTTYTEVFRLTSSSTRSADDNLSNWSYETTTTPARPESQEELVPEDHSGEEIIPVIVGIVASLLGLAVATLACACLRRCLQRRKQRVVPDTAEDIASVHAVLPAEPSAAEAADAAEEAAASSTQGSSVLPTLIRVSASRNSGETPMIPEKTFG
eukprot:TRINITY_DN7366_c0_g1_i2.p1 TRINITY_DN7366_c0_g1~~TRINITY_DN7366_c0_g1_i2.p1  ORF type:complete len:681 (+),score=138.24 TRINITY_DN7366_c0_g1_i2:160-2202(+)